MGNVYRVYFKDSRQIHRIDVTFKADETPRHAILDVINFLTETNQECIGAVLVCIK